MVSFHPPPLPSTLHPQKSPREGDLHGTPQTCDAINQCHPSKCNPNNEPAEQKPARQLGHRGGGCEAELSAGGSSDSRGVGAGAHPPGVGLTEQSGPSGTGSASGSSEAASERGSRAPQPLVGEQEHRGEQQPVGITTTGRDSPRDSKWLRGRTPVR